MASMGDVMTYAPFHNSDFFESLPGVVQASFIASKALFMSRLHGTYLYAYFLTDDLRGDHILRAYLETTNFALFTDRDRLYGGSHFCLCHICQVNYTLYFSQYIHQSTKVCKMKYPT